MKSRTLTKDEKLDCVARVALALGDNKAGHDAFLRILGDAEKRFKIAEQAEESLANIIDDKKSKLASVEAEIARLRAVLEWACERSGPSGRGMITGLCLGSIQDATEAALRGDWDAVRAAGVALPEEGE